MSSTGIDKVLILNENKVKSKLLVTLVVQGLKHATSVNESGLDDKGLKLVREGDYGLLIIVSDIKNEMALKAAKLASIHPTASIMHIADETDFSSNEDKEARERLLDIGAILLVKPLSKNSFLVAVNSADMAHIRLCKLRKKVEEEKVLARSKLILMRTLSLSEDEAHKYIEKEAMNSGQKKIDVAYEILRTYDNQQEGSNEI
ncbi:MAG: ANTAR domain-containing protein [Clostridiales bacterium]|nr:ANTAR domain-containing protein [Clostridiales bacterium]